jgi:dephospho-CoA kinase
MSSDEASSRLNAQMDIESKRTMADIIIDNSESLVETEKQVAMIIERLETSLKSG